MVSGPGPSLAVNPQQCPAIVRELERVVDRVLALHIGRASAVLEIVDALGTHEGILDTVKVEPDMEELVREQRPRI